MNMRETTSSPTFLKLIAHDLRWQILEALSSSDLRVHELVQALAQPQNLVSYHLHKLLEDGLVHEQRSIADGRQVYYRVDLQRLADSLASAGLRLHPALELSPAAAATLEPWAHTPRVLFICTHNSARSQMAEGLLRNRSQGKVEALSAGTFPKAVHPLAVQAASRLGIDISQQRSRSLEDVRRQVFDYVITVCDRARETCPVFDKRPTQIHWSIPDPRAATGSEPERFQAFNQAASQLDERIRFFLYRIAADLHDFPETNDGATIP